MGEPIFLSSQVKPCGDGGLVGQQPSAPDPYLHQKKDRKSNIYSFVMPTAVKPFFQNF